MKIDAEKYGVQWSKKRDPRITSIGKIIRALRLDELPQLFCVIKGTMSLIGPRPERPEIENELLKNIPYYSCRNILRPGRITVPQGSSLFEALAASGGNKPQTGQIEFIRFNEDGKTFKRTFAYKPTSKKNSLNNPLLTDGDIIIVRANIVGKTTSIIREIGTPLINAVGIYKIFD